MSETGSYHGGYNLGSQYNLENDDDRYLYDDQHLHNYSQQAVIGRARQQSSPESAGFPDDTPSEASASEVGTLISAAPTDSSTGLSINTLLQASSARPVMSIYSIKRELGPYFKRSARKIGLYAGLKRPPHEAQGGTDDVLIAMGHDRRQIDKFVTEPLPSSRERERTRDLHRRDGHRRTSTHACEHCHSTTPTPHQPNPIHYPHTPVAPHLQNLPQSPPQSGVAPHLYSPQYGAAMAPPLQPPCAASGGAMGVIGTVCTIIVAFASMGGAMVWMLARV